MKKYALALIALLLFSALTACAGAATPASQSMESAPSIAQEKGAPAYNGVSADTASAGQAETAAAVERIVIMNASLQIAVADPAAAMNTVTKMANDMGGFVVSSNLYKSHSNQGLEVPEANITVRVPAERLNEAMDQVKALVQNPEEDIINENVTGEDVTKEYTDLQSRLRNQEQAAEKLSQIMDQATNTEDVLNTYDKLTQANEQIEVLKGQIQYYDESARLSALSIRLVSQEAIAPLTIGSWKPVGTARNATQTLIDALKFLGNAAIWVVIFCLPIGLLLGVPAFFIIRGFRRWRIRRKALRTPAAPEI